MASAAQEEEGRTSFFVRRVSWTGNRTPFPGDLAPAVIYQ